MTPRIEAAKSWLSRISSAGSDFMVHWFLFPAVLAVSGGTGVWSMMHPKLLKALSKNRVSNEGRFSALLFIAGAAALVCLIYGGYVAWLKRKDRQWPTSRSLYPLHRLLSFVLAIPICAVLATPKIARSEPIFVTLLIMAAAMACFPTFFELARSAFGPLKDRLSLVSARFNRNVVVTFFTRHAPLLAVFTLFALYCVHMSGLAVNGLRAFSQSYGDMTIYTNIFHQSSLGEFLGCSMIRSGNHASAHFDPILILLSQFYRLHPSPEFLAVLQTVWLGLGIFPAFWLARRVLSSPWAGVGAAALYLVHPSLHQVNLYDFHSLSLIASPLLLALYFLEARRFKSLFILLPIILLIREDAALVMCFVGIAAIVSDRKTLPVGSLIILLSVSYFVIIKLFFMNSSGVIMSGRNAYNYSNYFEYMIPHGRGVGDILLTMLTNPVFTFRYLFSMEKFELMLRVLGPLMFVPLFSKKWRFMLLYSVVFILLSSRPAVFQPRFHYQILAFPFLIGLLPLGIKRIIEFECLRHWRPHLLAPLVGTILVSGVMSGVMFGTLSARFSDPRYVHALTPKQEKHFEKVKAFIDRVPDDASVIATHNIAPYLANRMKIHTARQLSAGRPVDYLLLDKSQLDKGLKKRVEKNIKKARYEELGHHEQTYFYRYPGSPE